MKVSFRKKTRQITEQFIYIDGEKFEFEDMYLTIMGINGSRYSIILTDQRMIDVLKTNDIISHPGDKRSGHGATMGKNGNKFVSILAKKKKELEKE